eukprot:1160137-Pelagomonas_calceolata.AAC.9
MHKEGVCGWTTIAVGWKGMLPRNKDGRHAHKELCGENDKYMMLIWHLPNLQIRHGCNQWGKDATREAGPIQGLSTHLCSLCFLCPSE